MGAKVVSGYTVMTTTGAEVQLTANADSVKWLNLIAPLSNKFVLVVGPTGLTDDKTAATAGCLLVPGKELPMGECNTSHVYINGKAKDEVYYIGGTLT